MSKFLFLLALLFAKPITIATPLMNNKYGFGFVAVTKAGSLPLYCVVIYDEKGLLKSKPYYFLSPNQIELAERGFHVEVNVRNAGNTGWANILRVE